MPKEIEHTRKINPLCQETELWTARDVQASEDEVSEFMHGLIRLIKPKVVVETGCYMGDTTEAIARALAENGRGSLYACDTDMEKVDFVQKRIVGYKEYTNIRIAINCCTGEELIRLIGSQIEFAFIDSSPFGAVREKEIETLMPFLKPYQMFALHDTAPQHEQIAAVAKRVLLPGVYFNTPRGLSLFQKL